MAAKPESETRPDAAPAADGLGDTWGEQEGAPRDPRPLGSPSEQPPARTEPVVVARWVQAVALTLGLLALYALLHAAKGVVLLFLIAGVVALIVNPLVSLLHRRAHLPRGLAILIVYVAFIAALGGVVALLVSPVTTQVQHFQRDVPQIVKQANSSLESVQSFINRHHLGVKIQGQGDTALQTVEKNVVKGSGSIVKFTTGLVQSLAQGAFDVVLILVLSVYMLLYGHRIGAVVRRVMPPGDGSPEDDYPLRVQKAVSGYVRGQLAFSITMGASAGVGLWVLGSLGVFPDGARYGLFFGAFYGLMELVPFVGPILGALPPVIVALFEDPVTAIWIALFFLALQQLEGHVVAPQVFGHSLRINPLLIIATLLIGSAIYGVIGALVSLPIAAVIRESGVYLSRHMVLEPWGTPSARALGKARASPPAEEGDGETEDEEPEEAEKPSEAQEPAARS